MELLMEVFDKYFVRIGTFNNYSSIMYNRTMSASSTYSLKVPFDRESVDLLMSGAYILIDETFLAEIKYIQKNTGDTTEIESKGYNVKNLLDERCVYPMQIFKGTPAEVIRQMVINNVINPTDKKRIIDEIKLSGSIPVVSGDIEMQQTGNSVYNEIVKIANEYRIGFEMIPNIVEYEDNRTNIESLLFNVFKGEDRTENNSMGNEPVVFSMELNNIESTSYIRDLMEYRNMAYVAGEGEGVSDSSNDGRIVVEVGEVNASGLNRKEIYVDARDLQKEREDGSIISDAVYNKMLTKRGQEKLEECRNVETYTGTILSGDNMYVYGKDYKEGDIVTLKDEELGLSFDVPITQVTITHDRSGEHIDVTFGYDNV